MGNSGFMKLDRSVFGYFLLVIPVICKEAPILAELADFVAWKLLFYILPVLEAKMSPSSGLILGVTPVFLLPGDRYFHDDSPCSWGQFPLANCT
jgi:hypothetical protein